MTPVEFRAARERLGYARGLGRKLTGREMANALNMGNHGWQTISKWENGVTPIPGPVQIAVRYLLEYPEG